MLRVSSLVRVLVALRVALVTAFLVVEVLEEDFLPVMASAAAAAATPVTAVRTLFKTLEAMLFLAARSFSSLSLSLARRACSLASRAACLSASSAASISAFWRSASRVAAVMSS